jgi:hypothetical protein
MYHSHIELIMLQNKSLVWVLHLIIALHNGVQGPVLKSNIILISLLRQEDLLYDLIWAYYCISTMPVLLNIITLKIKTKVKMYHSPGLTR